MNAGKRGNVRGGGPKPGSRQGSSHPQHIHALQSHVIPRHEEQRVRLPLVIRHVPEEGLPQLEEKGTTRCFRPLPSSVISRLSKSASERMEREDFGYPGSPCPRA